MHLAYLFTNKLQAYVLVIRESLDKLTAIATNVENNWLRLLHYTGITQICETPFDAFDAFDTSHSTLSTASFDTIRRNHPLQAVNELSRSYNELELDRH
jgi:hypothetical protein